MKTMVKRKRNGTEYQLNSGDPENQKQEIKSKAEIAKLQEIGKKYIRIPHPVLKNTFILKEKN